MSTTKKYVSLDKLGLYDEKIKQLINTNDAAALKSAKDYADSLATNYDAAGAAAAVEAKLNEEVTRAKAAEEANAAAAKKAQDEVDALELVVGGMYTNEQIDKAISDAQTEATYDDTQVKADIKANADAIDAIEADYLKAADKTELANAIAAEKTRAEGIEGGLETRLAAVEADYLKAADKTELEGKITTEAETARAAEKANADAIKAIADDYLTSADKEELEGMIQDNADAIEAHHEAIDATVATLVGDDKNKSVRTIANEELAKQLIPEGAQESLDTLAEIAAWIQDHPEDAAAMNEAIEALETLVGVIPEDATATDIVGYIAELVAVEKARAEEAEGDLDERVDALETAITTKVETETFNTKVGALESKDTEIEGKITATNTEVAKKADKTYVDEKVEALQGEDTAIKGRLDDIESILGEGEGSVADQIATAKQEAIDTAAEDATTKANKAFEDAKKYADEEDAKIESRVDALETASATHATKTEVEELAGRVTTAEGKITTLEGKMTIVEGKVAANETEIAKKADKATTIAGYGIEDAYTKTEVDAKITAAMDSIVEVSAEEINALFAPAQA